ncbi:MAG: glutamate--tRNA ligase [Candidatus Omnitrophota bacterium]
MNDNVRVRFAPSPTGHLHIGSARTALFNWLFARAKGGSFILRIEDTDLERSKEDYVAKILDDLRWLGLDWDEGPDKGGDHGPYRQSERYDIYRELADKLLKEGKAYHCYCSDEELKARRAEALKAGRSPQYDKRCRGLSKEDADSLRERGVMPALRFRVPEKKLVVKDIVRGAVTFDTLSIEDFVIMKSSGTPTFHFAVVCDDASMKITHIIRGEDHLPNTPKHILLFEALGFEMPEFAHMSLTMAPTGDRLSKRSGSTSIEFYREEGYLPEALVNYLVLLGWSTGDDREIFSREEMVKEFKLERLSRSSEAFDPRKLDWMSGIYIRKTKEEALARLSIPYLAAAGFIKKDIDGNEFERLKNIIAAIKDHITKIKDVTRESAVFFNDKFTIEDRDAKEALSKDSSKKVLELLLKKIEKADGIDEELLKNAVKEIGKETGLKGASLYHPIRVAMTGKLNGPELRLIIPLLSRESCIERLGRGLAHERDA